MSAKDSPANFSRRAFLKTAALGAAAAPLAAPAVLAAQETTPAQLPAMPRRVLGKTGVEVPILAMGGMTDTLNNQLLLKQAIKWGVTYWDTAEAYGNGQSEEGYGRFFSRNPEARKEVFLVTKLIPKGEDLTARLDKSLERLKTSYVDLFFIHSITSIADMDEKTMRWATEMKKAGKFKFFGFSTHTNMEDCLLGAASRPGLDVVMITYNFRLMREEKMRKAMDACHKAGIGLVAMKTQGGGPVKTDSQAELDAAGRFLEKGFTDKQARLKAVWENPQVASICSQMPSLTILAANVAAARDRTALAEADFRALHDLAQDTRQGYCAGCGAICAQAGGEYVREVMRYMMYYNDYGEKDLARELFASLPDEVRASLATTDYARAEKACPQGLAIADIMRNAAGLLA
ncbi:hypothetical protein JCM15519_36110 [Fundidesulfovibrio butyratiphilus]